MVDSLKDRIRALRRNAGRSEEEINRSAFSYIIGHLEISMALEAACKVLERNGFVPTSKIYDGCLTTHNPDGDLESTLRAAEAAVEVALCFPGIKLKEKPMYALEPFAIEGLSRAQPPARPPLTPPLRCKTQRNEAGRTRKPYVLSGGNDLVGTASLCL